MGLLGKRRAPATGQPPLASAAGNTSDASIFRYLQRGLSWSALLRVGGMAAAFATAVLLARMLGAEHYGLFQYVNSWIALLGIPAGLGLQKVVLRETSAARANTAFGVIKGVCRFSIYAGLTSTLLFGLVGTGLWWLFEGWEGFAVFLMAALTLPIMRVMSTLGAVQNGYERIVASQAPKVAWNAGFAACLALIWIVPIPTFGPLEAMEVRVAVGVAALLIAICLQVALQHDYATFLRDVVPVFRPAKWLKAGFPLVFLAAASTLNSNADILMLGGIMGTDSAGPYHAATRGSMLVSFGLTALLIPLSPLIARLYREDRTQLERVTSKAARRTLIITLPLALVLIACSRWFLEIFGPDFVVAQIALVILVAGQLVNVAAGPVQLLLVMTGYERIAALGVIASTATNVGLNAVLIPVWGLEGAATATAVSLVLWNMLLLWQVKKRLGFSIWGGLTW